MAAFCLLFCICFGLMVGVCYLELSYITASPLGVPQQVIAVNGKFPGPVINVTTNYHVVVNVKNKLDEDLLITWSGIQMRRSSWQDGVLGTNCPIPAKWNWTYQFQVKDQIGSFFYFPSLNMQGASGGFGPFIITRRDIVSLPFDTPYGDITIMIGDWYTRNHKALRKSLDNGKKLGMPNGVLINGKGPNRYNTTLVPDGIYKDEALSGLSDDDLTPYVPKPKNPEGKAPSKRGTRKRKQAVSKPSDAGAKRQKTLTTMLPKKDGMPSGGFQDEGSDVEILESGEDQPEESGRELMLVKNLVQVETLGADVQPEDNQSDSEPSDSAHISSLFRGHETTYCPTSPTSSSKSPSPEPLTKKTSPSPEPSTRQPPSTEPSTRKLFTPSPSRTPSPKITSTSEPQPDQPSTSQP